MFRSILKEIDESVVERDESHFSSLPSFDFLCYITDYARDRKTNGSHKFILWLSDGSLIDNEEVVLTLTGSDAKRAVSMNLKSGDFLWINQASFAGKTPSRGSSRTSYSFQHRRKMEIKQPWKRLLTRKQVKEYLLDADSSLLEPFSNEIDTTEAKKILLSLSTSSTVDHVRKGSVDNICLSASQNCCPVLSLKQLMASTGVVGTVVVHVVNLATSTTPAVRASSLASRRKRSKPSAVVCTYATLAQGKDLAVFVDVDNRFSLSLRSAYESGSSLRISSVKAFSSICGHNGNSLFPTELTCVSLFTNLEANANSQGSNMHPKGTTSCLSMSQTSVQQSFNKLSSETRRVFHCESCIYGFKVDGFSVQKQDSLQLLRAGSSVKLCLLLVSGKTWVQVKPDVLRKLVGDIELLSDQVGTIEEDLAIGILEALWDGDVVFDWLLEVQPREENDYSHYVALDASIRIHSQIKRFD